MNVHTAPSNKPALSSDNRHRPGSDLDPPSALAILTAATTLLVGAYTLVFAVTLDQGVGSSFRTALSNVFPLAILSAATYRLLRNVVLPRGVLFQASAHLVLAPIFAGIWYSAIITGQALIAALATGTLRMGQFSGVALVWQLFQGIVLYALVSAVTYALRGGRLASTVQLVTNSEPFERYLTREGDEFIPVEVEEIVLIRGAQDYAEVVTNHGKAHLVRMSLSEFETRLPHSKFLRVHRSTIINLARLGRAEPIGSGRMVLHMSGGHAVTTSRNGAQMLRSRVL